MKETYRKYRGKKKKKSVLKNGIFFFIYDFYVFHRQVLTFTDFVICNYALTIDEFAGKKTFVTTQLIPCLYNKMASILDFQPRDLKQDGALSKDCEVIILSMKSLAGLKNRVKSLVYTIFINEIVFHRLFDSILKVVFPSFSRALHGKSADIPVMNVSCVCHSAYLG